MSVIGEGTFRIRSVKDDAYILDKDAHNNVVVTRDAMDTWDVVVDVIKDTCTIHPSGDRTRSLDLRGQNMTAGTNITTYATNKTAAQEWQILGAPSPDPNRKRYIIVYRNAQTERALATRGTGRSQNCQIAIADNMSTRQLWYFEEV